MPERRDARRHLAGRAAARDARPVAAGGPPPAGTRTARLPNLKASSRLVPTATSRTASPCLSSGQESAELLGHPRRVVEPGHVACAVDGTALRRAARPRRAASSRPDRRLRPTCRARGVWAVGWQRAPHRRRSDRADTTCLGRSRRPCRAQGGCDGLDLGDQSVEILFGRSVVRDAGAERKPASECGVRDVDASALVDRRQYRAVEFIEIVARSSSGAKANS